MYLPYNNQL